MDGKERSPSHLNGGWRNDMKTPSFQVQDQREELHPCCRAQELIEDRIIRVCRYSLVYVWVVYI